jgi:hypothetical protein
MVSSNVLVIGAFSLRKLSVDLENKVIINKSMLKIYLIGHNFKGLVR